MNTFVRRVLTASVAGVCLAVAGTFAVPAAVAAIQQAQLDAAAQSFQLPPAAAAASAAAAAGTELERDAFAITRFTLVQWPVGADATVSSGFGYRSCAGCSAFHSGIDFTPGEGTPVEAVADGIVVGSSVADGSWGTHVTVEHAVDGVIYRTSYAHLRAGSMPLQPGDAVSRGQLIGRVGNTGQSMGAHLHFTVQTADGTFVDPLPWLRTHVNIVD